ncbi:MAG: protein phosphatase 2C domain-containing protein [Proteobacteria bacterium]|nr:protein phosphatase 2C domain-containing protein [Pseudomonadota bacterium]
MQVQEPRTGVGSQAVFTASGSKSEGGWELGWAQLAGTGHKDGCEDGVGHAIPGGSALRNDARPLAAAVADGVGGGARGSVASAALVDHCIRLPVESLSNDTYIQRWMELAEAHVQLKLREVTFSPGAATLAAAWLFPGTQAGQAQGCVVRVGDARAYVLSSEAVRYMSEDQTFERMGEQPPEGSRPEDPARMVGTNFMGTPEVVRVSLVPGDVLLLCSDGLHRGLTSSQITAHLGLAQDLASCSKVMAQSARANGSQDDITVLLARPAGHTFTSGLAAILDRLRKTLTSRKVMASWVRRP